MSIPSTSAFLLILLSSGLLACSILPASPDAVAEPSIAFAALNLHRDQIDCDETDPTPPICRVRRSPGIAGLEAMLDRGESLARSGNELIFALRSDADEVVLSGGLQYPLSRLEGTDLWTLTLRVEDLDRLALSYFFVRIGVDTRSRFTWSHWRGPLAPAEPAEVEELAGRLIEQTIDSRFLPAPRGLTIYEPPPVEGEPLAGVVYAGDGEAVVRLSKVVEPLITAGSLPRILLVGMNAAAGAQRSAEYILDATPGNEAFIAHESFFLDEVLPDIESRFPVPRDGDRRALFGFSASASWAIETALRHPDRFDHVIAFSPAGRESKIEEPSDARKIAFFVAAGTLEPGLHRKATAWTRLFEEHGIAHTLRVEVAGHDFVMWRRLFPEALTTLGWDRESSQEEPARAVQGDASFEQRAITPVSRTRARGTRGHT